jgi:hypothetical protein
MAAFQVNLLRQYINALTVNLHSVGEPKPLNLIFDSGAVNGLIGIGAALYLHHLEKIKHIKVNKVSGCSVGSLIALWYLCGCPETIYSHIETLFAYYKKHKDFFIFEQMVKAVIQQFFITDAAVGEKLNGILYINYYDTKKCKQRVVSKFKNRAHLTRCIIRSAHIPFLTSKSHKYQGRYIDGIAPFIFKIDKNTSCKNLFIQLIQFTRPFDSLRVKKETNIYSRLLRGVVDTNEFFINGSSSVCSYVNYKTRIHLWYRQYVVLFILYVVDLFFFFKNAIPVSFKKTCCYSQLCALLCKFGWPTIMNLFT